MQSTFIKSLGLAAYTWLIVNVLATSAAKLKDLINLDCMKFPLIKSVLYYKLHASIYNNYDKFMTKIGLAFYENYFFTLTNWQ